MNLVQLHLDGAVAEIRFNRPEVLNALDLDTARAFEDAVDRLLDQPEARVTIISGEGRAFMAGGDLGYFHREVPDARPGAARRLIGAMNAAILKLTRSPLITLACVQGSAAGAGMSLALMCDLAIAAEDARFNLAYVKVGTSPDCGGSHALVQLVGLRHAMEIALLSDTLDAATALRLGLVNRTAPPGELREAAWAWGRRLSKASPSSLAATKRLLRGAVGASLPDQLQAEMDSFASLSAGADFEEALDAFFHKREPAFTGR